MITSCILSTEGEERNEMIEWLTLPNGLPLAVIDVQNEENYVRQVSPCFRYIFLDGLGIKDKFTS